MEEINLNDLTAEQLEVLTKQALDRKREMDQKVRADREAYKSLVGETVDAVFPELLDLSEMLSDKKRTVYEAFAKALEMKAELFDVKDGQNKHSFMNGDNTLRISLGHNVNDNYDDTVSVGIEKVRHYIASLAQDDNSRVLVDAILRLLKSDDKGNLKASKVIELSNMAEQSGNADFIDGVRIIRDAYRPIRTKTFIRAERKNVHGAWVSVPLGVTEA